MKETINTYLLGDLNTIIPMDRDAFYEEQVEVFEKTGKPTRASEVVNVFIFNLNQEMLAQKRSYAKRHNPGLLDKSMGGHVQYGDGIDYTVMVETVQELQTPSIVLRNKTDFLKTRRLLNDYLTTIAIVKHVRSKLYLIEKVFDNKLIKIANKAHIFLGVYGGSIRPADREAQGILFYTLPELNKEMEKSPKFFTNDMHILMKDLKDDVEEFLRLEVQRNRKS